MPQYMLVLDAHAMDHVPDEDMPNVDRPRTRSARRSRARGDRSGSPRGRSRGVGVQWRRQPAPR